MTSHYRVCSEHFVSEHFQRTYPRILLKKGAVPVECPSTSQKEIVKNIAYE